MLLPLDQIKFPLTRRLRYLGDLRPLANSISGIGLLHPLIVTSDYLLISGSRRLAAMKLLGWKEVPVRVVSTLEDTLSALRIEREEDACRQITSSAEKSNREIESDRPALKDLHCQWGISLLVADDRSQVLVEHDIHGEPVAVVNYKSEDAPLIHIGHPLIQALSNLGDRTGLPVFVVRYADDFSWWYAQPLNDAAKHWLPQAEHLTERQWVELLYRIRGRELPENLFENDVLI